MLSCGFVLGGNAIKTRPVFLWRTQPKKLEVTVSGGRDEAVVESRKIEFGFSHTQTLRFPTKDPIRGTSGKYLQQTFILHCSETTKLFKKVVRFKS